VSRKRARSSLRFQLLRAETRFNPFGLPLLRRWAAVSPGLSDLAI
jgi:hypothetical protein